MTTTTYYNLNIVEGTDIVNPLTVDNPNYETIDEVMHENAVAGVTLATEIANATVHAITRENSECAVIRFIATSEWKAGDTVTVDGVPVTALLPSGETLPDGAYVINANVLCILTGTNLTVYAERKKTDNANEIAYNETTVAAELTELNGSLSNIGSRYISWGSSYNLTGNTELFGASLTLAPGTYIVLQILNMGSSTENNFYSSVVCSDGEAVVTGAQVAVTNSKGFGINVPWVVHVTSRATIKTRYLASLDGVVNTDAIIAIRVK